MGTAAIVGGIIPVAVGAAYANKRLNKKRMTAVFFGDGATDEGVFWESLNAACLMKLPIIFVLEDNGLAVFTHKKFRQGYKSIIDIVKEFDCDTLSDDTTDAEKIYKLTKQAVSSVRRKNRPCFMHLKYYRYLEHVGVYEDFDAGYRSRREFEKWQKADPVALQRKKLLKLGFSEAKIKKAESAIDKQIEDSVRKAKEAAFPAEEELLRGIYA
jgi:pyruvate dehydrogenase E1 component alpha subunit